MIRPVMIYRAEALAVTRRGRLTGKNRNENAAVDKRVSLKDRKRNEDIRKTLGVACITDKIREDRLRWYCDVMRREDKAA